MRAAADADRFRRAAHSLKSNCNTFGLLHSAHWRVN
jgi:HPt (histidine-containing phosphotransfer) domain-containing protein